jgi:hypothetical protein
MDNSYRLNDSMDLSAGYNHANDDDDIEGRVKPKVSYICGGNFAEFINYRLRQREQVRQRLCDQMHVLQSQNLLQEAREEDPSVSCSMNFLICYFFLLHHCSCNYCDYPVMFEVYVLC